MEIFSADDYRALISVLGKFQGTLDAVGKGRRDVRFLLKERVWLPDEIVAGVLAIDNLLGMVLAQGDSIETQLLKAMKKPTGVEPPGGAGG